VIRRLLLLYPRAWRERYGAEFDDLVASIEGPRWRIAADIVRGAFDAHLCRLGGRWRAADAGLRRSVRDGLLLSAFVATALFLSNVVFLAGPSDSDNDPGSLVQIGVAYLLVGATLVGIGARAGRRSAAEWAPVAGGAAAGFVLAVGLLVASLVIDNVFLSLVGQQHDKRVAFEASGWSSMRVYLNVRSLLGALVVIPAGTVVGGLLGMVGGLLPRRARTR
jgi:hypothetical protein